MFFLVGCACFLRKSPSFARPWGSTIHTTQAELKKRAASQKKGIQSRKVAMKGKDQHLPDINAMSSGGLTPQ